MRRASFLSESGRGIFLALMAACSSLAVSGCSSSVSRFDFPAFSLNGSDESGNAGNADYAATASLPVPQESVYSPGSGGDARLERAALPPPAYSPRPNPAYSPAPQARAAAPEPAYRPKPVQGHRVKVAKGDTLSSLSRRYGLPVEAIVSANNLPDGRLAVGQELVLPGVSAAKAAAVAKRGTPNVRVVKTETIRPPEATSLAEEEAAEAAGEEAGVKENAKEAAKDSAKASAAAGTARNGGNAPPDIAASQETTGEEAPRVAKNDQLPSPDPMAGNSFRWPVKGRVISGFGTRPDGGHNDGIDVAVPQGTSVKAAENGVVAYAGNELKGYGNLVLVRHANNWVSAYANNATLLVKRGDKVRRGQIIAKAGATGAVSAPQVHFELRKGSRPVDPTKHMSDQAANAE
jgi:murein DD-endopeptidase MepM/ murein hydrolase activator NlpD